MLFFLPVSLVFTKTHILILINCYDLFCFIPNIILFLPISGGTTDDDAFSLPEFIGM